MLILFQLQYFKKIYTAKDGEEGLALYKEANNLKSTCFQLIISDIVMPKMNGVEMCKKIKEEELCMYQSLCEANL